MRVVSLDVRRGIVEVQVEYPEDLYYLSMIIRKGDVVYGWTTRQVKVDREIGSEKGERVRVFLGVEVEGLEYHKFTRKLRIRGKITDAPEELHAKGRYHTISVSIGDTIRVAKKQGFSRLELSVIRESSTRPKKLVLLSVDLDEVAIGILRPQGVEVKLYKDYPRPDSRKGRSLREHLRTLLRDVIGDLERVLNSEKADTVVLLAPSLVTGWCLDFLASALKQRGIEVRTARVSVGGLAGIYEAVRTEDLRRMLGDLRVIREAKSVERLVSELGGKGRVALGVEEVRRALEWGLVKELVVLDDAILSDEEILSLVEKAIEQRIGFTIVTAESEAGAILERLGRIAAILYYTPS